MAEGYQGAIAGGGRYDNMIEKYTNLQVPACGFSVGFERLIMLLEEKNFTIPNKNEKICYLLTKEMPQEEKTKILEEANQNRQKNQTVKIVYKNKNYKFQKDNLEKEGYKII